MDDAFRQQLDVKEQQHSSEMQRVRLEAPQDVDVANKRVSAHQCYVHCNSLRTYTSPS